MACLWRIELRCALVLPLRPTALAALVSLTFLAGPILAQSGGVPTVDTQPEFVIADVHVSPHSMTPYMRATTQGDRYVIRQADMVDLIAKAYGVAPDNVLGGLSWLETDRFDLYAKMPRKTSPEASRLMLRGLLMERFKLVVHLDSRPMPAFVLTAGKGSAKITESDGSGDPGCRYSDPQSNPPAGTAPLYKFSCHNTSMASFAEDLHEWAGDYLTNPVVDATGLKGTWDFDLEFHSKDRAARVGADGVTVFDAIEKQLGLKLEAKTAPLPVLFVDSVNETPTANVPGFEKILPPPPPPEFDVATVRPSAPDEKEGVGRIDGGQASLQAGNLKMMIAYAWDIPDERLVGAPKWMETDRFDIMAKASSDAGSNGPGVPPIYPGDLRLMMRKLLEDRFKLVAHMEDRPLDAYTLIAANPKLRKADPTNRTGCKEGPGADGKDPRIANPILGRLLTCRNMTMTQFAEILQTQAREEIHTPVLDATGIAGTYDFTLSFSRPGQLRSGGTPATGDAGSESDPSGGVSLFDAINRQLGLKLVKQKRPVPALVIDHIEERPTEN
jgi:uncharacterized protein (TIGR03435 family)